MASTLGVDNPFRYRGYYYDTENRTVLSGKSLLQSGIRQNDECGQFVSAGHEQNNTE